MQPSSLVEVVIVCEPRLTVSLRDTTAPDKAVGAAPPHDATDVPEPLDPVIERVCIVCHSKVPSAYFFFLLCNRCCVAHAISCHP